MLLVTGASGHIGRRVADLLTKRGVDLRLMSRTPERVPRSPRVEVVQGDFALPETLAAAFRDIDAALVISGSAPPGQRALNHCNAFAAAATARLRHVVYVSLQGSGPRSKFAYSRDHDVSEGFLRAVGLPDFTILRNAFYLDMLPSFIDDNGVLRDPVGKGRAAFISREDAAQAAAAALVDPPGGCIDVTGPEAMSVAEAISRLAKLTGRSLRHEVTRTGASSALSGGGDDDLYTGWFEAIAEGDLRKVTKAVERLTGRPPLNLEAYFSAFPDALGSLSPAR